MTVNAAGAQMGHGARYLDDLRGYLARPPGCRHPGAGQRRYRPPSGGQGLAFPSPVREDGPGWRREVDLSFGVTAAQVITRRAARFRGALRSVAAPFIITTAGRRLIDKPPIMTNTNTNTNAAPTAVRNPPGHRQVRGSAARPPWPKRPSAVR